MSGNTYFISSNGSRNGKKKYGFLHFLLDLFLICITGGLWLLWILFRFFRNNS